jgi:AraC-like DNA-binding protein
MVVRSELEKLGLNKFVIGFGEVRLKEGISPEQLNILDRGLKKSGFELVGEIEGNLVEKVKKIIIDLVHYSEERLEHNIPYILSSKLNQDYDTLNALFLKIENQTIENYFLTHKIERVKELLVYYKLNLHEIASQLNYSSIAHLTSQFKSATGLSPAHYRKISERRVEIRSNVGIM